MRLGKHQLCLLASMASPFSALVVGDKVSRSLVDKGLLAPHFSDKDAWHGITAKGLRELADQFEAGNLNQFLAPDFQRDKVRLYMSTKAGDSPKRNDD